MLLGLLLFLGIQRIVRSYSNYSNNNESIMPGRINHDNNNIKAARSAIKPNKDISNVLRKIIANTSLDGLSQTHIHHSFAIPPRQESLLSSSNSHIASNVISETPNKSQLQPKTVIQTISESYELTPRKSTKQSSINRKDSINSSEYKRKYSTKL